MFNSMDSSNSNPEVLNANITNNKIDSTLHIQSSDIYNLKLDINNINEKLQTFFIRS